MIENFKSYLVSKIHRNKMKWNKYFGKYIDVDWSDDVNSHQFYISANESAIIIPYLKETGEELLQRLEKEGVVILEGKNEVSIFGYKYFENYYFAEECDLETFLDKKSSTILNPEMRWFSWYNIFQQLDEGYSSKDQIRFESMRREILRTKIDMYNFKKEVVEELERIISSYKVSTIPSDNHKTSQRDL